MFEFNLLQLKWEDSKWISICEVETPDNWGALIHIGWIWGGEWELDLLYARMALTWMARKFMR